MLIQNSHSNTKGFSLIELMISLFLGSLLLAMVIGLYVEGVSNGAKSAKFSRLRTDLQSMLTLMENDIRRAGFGGESFLVDDGQGKKITARIVTLSNKHCIVYAYDHDLNGRLNKSDKLGFCYNASKKTVEFVTDVNSSGGGYFVNLSDPSFIKITALTFSETTSSSATATLRNIKIELAGELTADSAYKQSISTTVQIRNVELD